MKNISQHTPGPWHVMQIGGDRCLVVGPIEIGNPDVAELFDGPDARLIAAAPELLAACESALLYIRSDPAVHPLIVQLQEVISKAK